MSAQRDLLLAVLAVDCGYLSVERFWTACHDWASEGCEPALGSISLMGLLSRRGWIDEAQYRELEQRISPTAPTQDGPNAPTLVPGVAAALPNLVETDVPPVPPNASVPAETLVVGPAWGGATPSGKPVASGAESRYLLSRELARGGLGRIWVANDTALNREVALKEILPEHAQSPEFTGRFLFEARVAGQLEHPGIVPVYELGRRRQDNQPYYTMRLIKGQTLREAIAEYHRTRLAGAENRLELLRLLGAFANVCQALAYAHSRRVIHRDLKPDNVILGEFGEVVVLDWGVAKLYGQEENTTGSVGLAPGERSEETHAGRILGTPAYMAPEQAQGLHERIDPRTDVYGLGAILFELLTGRVPHVGNTVYEVLKHVTEGPTPQPRTVLASVPKPLDAVCARAMAKTQDDRYPDAMTLARDVQRWLVGEPVSAYSEPWWQRGLRWGRRHKSWVIAAVVLTLSAFLSLTIALILISREQARTEQARARAERNFDKARTAVDEMLSKVGDEQLADVPQLEPIRLALLEKAAAFYEDFLQDKGEDPSVRFDAAQARYRLGGVHRLLGKHEQAQTAFHKAIDELERLSADFPGKPKYRELQAQCHNWLGESLRATKDPKDAEKAYSDALVIQNALRDQFPNDLSVAAKAARSHYNLGILFFETNRLKESDREHSQAITLLNLSEDTEHHELSNELARSHLNRGQTRLALNRASEAGEDFRTAVQQWQALAKRFPENREYRFGEAVAYFNLGVLSWQDVAKRLPQRPDKKLTDSLVVDLARAAQGLERLSVDFPFIPRYREELGKCYTLIGLARQAAKEPEEAQRSGERARAVFERLKDDYPKEIRYRSHLGMALNNLGWFLLEREKFAEAIAVLEEAVLYHQGAHKANPENPHYRVYLRENYVTRGDALLGLGRHAEAAKLADELCKLQAEQGEHEYQAARLLAKCARVPSNDVLQRDYADRAVRLFRTALQQNPDVAKRQALDPAFEALRGREDFRRLLRPDAEK